jgi:hypothetical protein
LCANMLADRASICTKYVPEELHTAGCKPAHCHVPTSPRLFRAPRKVTVVMPRKGHSRGIEPWVLCLWLRGGYADKFTVQPSFRLHPRMHPDSCRTAHCCAAFFRDKRRCSVSQRLMSRSCPVGLSFLPTFVRSAATKSVKQSRAVRASLVDAKVYWSKFRESRPSAGISFVGD